MYYNLLLSSLVYVDLTPPLKSWVRDGESTENEIQFSSDVATVEASWGPFEDPESGIKSTDWSIYRQSLGKFRFMFWSFIFEFIYINVIFVDNPNQDVMICSL